MLGGGVAGANAAWIAAGMGADVAVLDLNLDRLRYIDQIQRGRDPDAVVRPATRSSGSSPSADLVIGAVLVPGARRRSSSPRRWSRRCSPAR